MIGIDTIFKEIGGIADKFFPDKNKKLEFEKHLLDHKVELENIFSQYAKYDHERTKWEMENKGFKSWWRPVTMFGIGIFFLLYLFFYYIMPAIVVYGGLNIWIPQPPDLPEHLWYCLTGSLLGFGALRSLYDKKR